VEKSIAEERKVSELMAKLNAEQFEFNKYKSEHGRNSKISDDVGAQQVQILQAELTKQN
jgi:hypothetical protein